MRWLMLCVVLLASVPVSAAEPWGQSVFVEEEATPQVVTPPPPTPLPAVARLETAPVVAVLRQRVTAKMLNETVLVPQRVCGPKGCQMRMVPVTRKVSRPKGRQTPVGAINVATLPLRAEVQTFLATHRGLIGDGTMNVSWSRSGDRKFDLGGAAVTLPDKLSLTYKFVGDELVIAFSGAKPSLVAGGLSVPLHELRVRTDRIRLGLSWCPDIDIGISR